MWGSMFRWLDPYAKPETLYHLCGRLLPYLMGLALFTLLLGNIWGLAFSPSDYQQGDSYRIIYIHVPSAIWSMGAYSSMAIAAFIGLVWQIRVAQWAVLAIAPIGAVYTVIALFTGAAWGKPMWGTWWVWDARLTSMLVLFFLYLGYISLRGAFDDPARGARSAAILALVGFVNVPIIKFSVDWWNTLHQPASVIRMDGPTIHPDMLLPLILMAVAFKLLFVWLVLLKMRAELMAQRVRVLRHRQAAA